MPKITRAQIIIGGIGTQLKISVISLNSAHNTWHGHALACEPSSVTPRSLGHAQ